jgi:chitin synthase
MCSIRTEREFTHMHYTCATCDPDNFDSSNFYLRQAIYGRDRETELFIVTTMYNEDAEHSCRTMVSVIKNVAHLCSRDRSKTWGKDTWKKVVVCIVCDGRQHINPQTLNVIAAMGAYENGMQR